jgi:hypothetical protein
MLNNHDLLALERKLLELYGTIRRKESLGIIAKECEDILDGHRGSLVRPNWRDTWRRDGWVVSGWFEGPGLTDKQADALYDLFVEMTRFALDPKLRRLHRQELKEACYIYIKRRGLHYKQTRPSKPTCGYCLMPGNRIRWNGEKKVEPKLWHLLDCVLKAGRARVSFLHVAREVWGLDYVPDRRIQRRVSDLNNALLAIGFPATLRSKQGTVFFAPPQ